MSSGLLTLPQLLAGGGLLLLVLGVSSWLILREDKLARQLLIRLDTVSGTYARINTTQQVSRPKVEWSGGAKAWSALAGLFGYDLAKTSQYPAKVVVVLGFALILAVVLSHLLSILLGPMARLAIPLLWVGASRKAFSSFEAKRTGRLYIQFPDALAMIVRSVRAGVPVSESVRNVSKEALEPTATEFGVLSDQLNIGTPLEKALRDCAARNRLPEYRFFATALSLQAQTGGGLAETLDNLSDVIRKRVAVRNRAHALASEARTTTYILAGLPVVVGLLLALINPGYVGLLFTDSTGNMILAGAISMLSIGMFAMRTIISKSLR